MTDPSDMEELAAAEHRSWAKWTRHMLGEMEKEGNGDFHIIGLNCVQNWMRQMNTQYVDLPKQEKESDRGVVRTKLPLYRPKDDSFRGGATRRG